MPVFQNEEPEDAADDYGDVDKMATRLGLEGEDREHYIQDHMIQLGYRPVLSRESFAKPAPEPGEPDPNQSPTARWGFGKRGQAQGQPPGQGAAPPGNSSRQQGDPGDRF